MVKRKSEFEDMGIEWEPLSDLEVEAEAVELPPPPVSKTIVVREMRRANDGRILVDADNGQFYLLPADFDFGGGRTATIDADDSRLEKLYTWNKEIEAMLPDRVSLVKAIRRSLYMAGAFQKGDLARNEVIRNALRYAFPYIIKEIEE